MSDNQNRFINPEGLWRSTGYSHIVETRASRTLYFAGQVAVDEQGNIVAPGDMAGQVAQIFDNMQKMLASVNASLADIVKLTYFVSDLSQVQAIRDARPRYFPDNLPASTVIGISLLRPEIVVEIEAIAALYD